MIVGFLNRNTSGHSNFRWHDEWGPRSISPKLSRDSTPCKLLSDEGSSVLCKGFPSSLPGLIDREHTIIDDQVTIISLLPICTTPAGERHMHSFQCEKFDGCISEVGHTHPPLVVKRSDHQGVSRSPVITRFRVRAIVEMKR